MKKLFIILAALLISASFAFSQSMQIAESEYYKVFSEISLTNAQEIAKKMDAFSTLFNSYFHFNPGSLTSKLKIRVFKSKENYDTYLKTIIPETKESFAYVQYTDPEKSELLVFDQEDEKFETALVHHGFVQFLKSFIPEPPLWLQKGFAVYLEKSQYESETGTAVFKENLSWLDTFKEFIKEDQAIETETPALFPISSLLFIDAQTANTGIDAFYCQTWGLVSFMIDSKDAKYTRVLWDSINALSPAAKKNENEMRVVSKAFEWVTKSLFLSDFNEYILSLKTFPDLIEDGMNYYTEKDYVNSEISFVNAIDLVEKHYIPYYYLGLINYARNDYTMAEYYYHSSIQMGAESGLVYYTLGVNAYADSRLEDAKFYLKQSEETDPSGYGQKASLLFARILEENPEDTIENGTEGSDEAAEETTEEG